MFDYTDSHLLKAARREQMPMESTPPLTASPVKSPAKVVLAGGEAALEGVEEGMVFIEEGEDEDMEVSTTQRPIPCSHSSLLLVEI